MKKSLLGAYEKEALLRELDVETFGEVKESVIVDQLIAHQKRMLTDRNYINNEQYDDGQWIEVVPNLASWKCDDGQWIEVTQNLSSWKCSDGQWIEVTQNLSSWKCSDGQWIEVTQNLSSWQYDDCEWIEVTQNLTQEKYGDGNCIEVVKQIPEKLGLMQVRYLMVLAVVGFIAVLQLLQNSQVY